MARSDIRANAKLCWNLTESSSPCTDSINSKALAITGGTFNGDGPGSFDSILLDGVDDKGECTNASLGTLIDIGASDDAWVEVWFQTSSDLITAIFYKSVDGGDARAQATKRSSAESDPIQCVVNDGTDNAAAQGGTNLADGVWHQLVWVLDRAAGLLRNYIDGSQVQTGDASAVGAVANAGSLLFGIHPSGVIPLPGSIALLRVGVGYLASATDVTDLYNSGSGLNPAAAPTVSAITPSSGENTGSVSITDLVGTGFLWDTSAGTAVKLTKSGESDINCTAESVVSDIKITCTAPITGAAAGFWNVVVTNINGSVTLTNGFEVTAPAAIGDGGSGENRRKQLLLLDLP